MRFFSFFTLFALLTGFAFAQDIPKNISFEKDIIYKTVGDWEGRLDLYLPKNKQRNALVFYVHGGGWTHGKKEAEYEKIRVFIENGFAVANIEYRVAKQAPAPAAVEDVHCALVYLIKNADQYNIDRRKIILIGGSAGAHLALLVGLQSVNPIFAGDCNYSKIRIAGIISKYGPTDLMTWEPARNPKKASSSWLATRINDVEFIEALSPVNYVSKRTKNIPVLFIHGKQDNTVPINQSEVLYYKLLQNGNQTTLHVVENGKHGNFSKEDTRVMDDTMIDFVRRCIER